jgi:lysozyme
MKPSQTAIDFITREEGCVLHAYADSAGVMTIGIGSTMYKDGSRVKKGDTITKEQAVELLSWEVENKSKSVSAFVLGVPLTQHQFDALVSFAYNVGIGALQQSTLLKKVKANPNDPSIREEFARWNKIRKDGKLIPSLGLTKRRLREWQLYSKQTKSL